MGEWAALARCMHPRTLGRSENPGGGHCALDGVLRGHFLGIKMLQLNKSLRSFMSNFCSF